MSVRRRHGGSAGIGLVSSRDTHAPPGSSPGVVGVPVSIARDGEQSQTADLADAAIETGHFSPGAAAPQVNNNPAAPTTASVTVDPDGLHVKNGAIFIEDYAGASVLGAAGFAGAWSDFVHFGVYNGSFGAGVSTQPQTAITEVGGGITEAQYLASLSTLIPYWVIKERTGNCTYQRNLDAGDYLFRVLGVTPGTGLSNVKIYQHVPVVGSEAAVVRIAYQHASVATVGNLRITTQNVDRLHQPYGVETSSTVAVVGSASDLSLVHSLEVDAQARFLRVTIDWDDLGLGTGGTVAVLSVQVTQRVPLFYDSLWNRWQSHLPISVAGGLTLRGQGTAFPLTDNVDGDLFYRTDLARMYRRHALLGQWLSLNEYTEPLSLFNNQSVSGGTIGNPGRTETGGLWLVRYEASFYITPGGTALSSLHKWDLLFKTYVANAATTRATISINSGAVGTWRRAVVELGLQVLDTTMMVVDATKTGTPGNVTSMSRITYKVAGE